MAGEQGEKDAATQHPLYPVQDSSLRTVLLVLRFSYLSLIFLKTPSQTCSRVF